MIQKLANIFIPKHNVNLGRWQLKHNIKYCEEYIQNYYGEPGYQNILKSEWLEKMKLSENKKNN